MKPVIVVENLRKVYGNTVAVDDISFEVADGEIFGLLGPNGTGKTTTVECLQGLRHPDSGRMQVLGLNTLTEAQALRRRIGSQLQASALPDRMKVWEALDLFSSLTKNPLDWRVIMEQWGLAEKSKSSFSSLSGGQKQRLFIALALVNNPGMVFLDEMTTGLDPAARRIAWELIRDIRDKGTTVILVTHFMDEAEKLCNRVAIMDKGRIIDIDTPQGLIVKHAGEVRITFTSEKAALPWLEKVPHVRSVKRRGQYLEVEGDGPVLALVANSLVQNGITPTDLRVEQPTLEDVFLKLVGISSID